MIGIPDFQYSLPELPKLGSDGLQEEESTVALAQE
jgi:hypothetical protein